VPVSGSNRAMPSVDHQVFEQKTFQEIEIIWMNLRAPQNLWMASAFLGYIAYLETQPTRPTLEST
jgi:hypothetical protein